MNLAPDYENSWPRTSFLAARKVDAAPPTSGYESDLGLRNLLASGKFHSRARGERHHTHQRLRIQPWATKFPGLGRVSEPRGDVATTHRRHAAIRRCPSRRLSRLPSAAFSIPADRA